MIIQRDRGIKVEVIVKREMKEGEEDFIPE